MVVAVHKQRHVPVTFELVKYDKIWCENGVNKLSNMSDSVSLRYFLRGSG